MENHSLHGDQWSLQCQSQSPILSPFLLGFICSIAQLTRPPPWSSLISLRFQGIIWFSYLAAISPSPWMVCHFFHNPYGFLKSPAWTLFLDALFPLVIWFGPRDSNIHWMQLSLARICLELLTYISNYLQDFMCHITMSQSDFLW